MQSLNSLAQDLQFFKFMEQAIASKYIIRVIDPADKRKWNFETF